MLAQEDIEFIKAHLAGWLVELSLGKPPVGYEIELHERIVRVEEELKHQRELMRQGFELMDKRFEELREDMNRRFEAVDKRFEGLREDMNRRFEAMDKRFEAIARRIDRFMIWSMGIYVTGIGAVLGVLWHFLGPN